MAEATRFSLRVSSLDGIVTMTVPRGVPVDQAIDFARDRREWITRAQSRSRPSRKVAEGIQIPVEGQLHVVVLGRRREPLLSEGRLTLPRRAPGRACAAFLKLLARDRLAEACDRHAHAAGVTYSTIVLRDPRSRWGSCSEAGRLMFSWRLAMAPPPVLDYVAAHEVAHLVHMDHSAAYWRVVEELMPGWRGRRLWLRESGADLHAYRFDD